MLHISLMHGSVTTCTGVLETVSNAASRLGRNLLLHVASLNLRLDIMKETFVMVGVYCSPCSNCSS